MSISKTITRTDLANILNEIGIGATLINGNTWSYIQETGSSTITQTGTTEKTIISGTFTSKTGCFIVVCRLFMQTSQHTSLMNLRIDGNRYDFCTLNATTDKEVLLFGYANGLGVGDHTITVTMNAQDSATTAIIPAYRTLRALAVDLQKGHYNSAIQMEDYIVEQGTDGIWTYRKWNSGIAECWGTHSWTITAWAAWGNVFESNSSYASYPSSLFISTPMLNVSNLPTSEGGAVASVELNQTTASASRTPAMYLMRGTNGSTNVTGYVSIIAKGRWK